MDIFQMSCTSVYSKWNGKVFLFEKSLLLTEIFERDQKQSLRYKIHVNTRDFLGINTDNKNVFELVVNDKTITFNADSLTKTQEWVKLLSKDYKSE